MLFLALTGFLLYGSIHTAHSAILNQSVTEGSDTFLFCGNVGKVIWSKGVDGGRGDILTAEHGDVTVKHKPDPDDRYSVLSDLSLVIKNLSLSDSGIYYCNTVPVVSLTVTPFHSNTTEKKDDSAGKGVTTVRPTMESDSEGNNTLHPGSTAKTDDDSGENDSTAETDEDSDEKGITTEKKDDSAEKGRTAETDERSAKKGWMIAVAAVIGVSCMVVVLFVLWRVITKMKTGQQNEVHLYDSFNNLPAAEQPAGFSVTQNQANIYTSITKLPEASQGGEQQRGSEAVYFLAQNPASNTIGDQQRENETVYFLAGTPASITTDQDQVEPAYTKIQKPVKNT